VFFYRFAAEHAAPDRGRNGLLAQHEFFRPPNPNKFCEVTQSAQVWFDNVPAGTIDAED
jgi:hypothetical protein